jgi:hypothetical protein
MVYIGESNSNFRSHQIAIILKKTTGNISNLECESELKSVVGYFYRLAASCELIKYRAFSRSVYCGLQQKKS